MNTISASAAATSHFVSIRDVAEALHMPIGTVGHYLSRNPRVTNKPGSKFALVKETAAKMGYMNREQRHQVKMAIKPAKKPYYRNTAFRSIQEQRDYMRYLRDKGYGNTDIARKCGVARITVYRNIGATPADLAKMNRVVAQTLRAQKNAARSAYVLNQPILEYNAKVEKHNKMKAELRLLQLELLEAKPAIEHAAAKFVAVPSTVNLATVRPTALM